MMPNLFDIVCYPDEQHSVNLNLGKLDVKKPLSIKCRIKNFVDLEILLCLVAALRKHDFYIENIQFVYLFGMRADRSFSNDDCNYFRDVLAPIINGLNISEVYVFAPHNETVLNYIKGHIRDIYINFPDGYYLWGDSSSCFLKKSLPLSESIAHSFMGSFDKKRENGAISIAIKNDSLERLKNIGNPNSPIIIMDDLCDAGGTFIAEAQYLRDVCGVKNPLHLFVAHGLFTKGLEPLLQYFDKIIYTNSYQDIVHPKVNQIQAI